MVTITVQAVYEKGVLKPKTKLNLPEHSVVEINVKMAQAATQTAFHSLIGIWEHLPDSEVQALEKTLSDVRKRSNFKLQKTPISKKK